MTPHRTLSDITEQLQFLAKAKHDDSIMTGREFVDEYGEPGPIDTDVNREIATAGGDVQNAYSKVHSVYMKVKNINENNKNEFKLQGEADQSLNTEVVVADLDFAIEFLEDAIPKLESHDIPIADDLKNLKSDIEYHKTRIENTGMVLLR